MVTTPDTRPSVTPDLQAVFDTLLYMDDHQESPELPTNAGRYTDALRGLVETLDLEGFDGYRKEKARFLEDNPRIQVLFATYHPSKETVLQNVQPVRYPDPTPIDVKKVIEYHEQNEYGDALLFADVFHDRVCYDHTAKEWYVWAGHYWQQDKKGQVRILVSGKLGAVYLKASGDLNVERAKLEQQIMPLLSNPIENAKQLEPLQDKYKQVKAEMDLFAKRVKDLRTTKRMNSVLTYVQSLMGVTSDQWDINPWLLGTPSGVINLRTGTCHDGKPGHYIRTVIPTQWTGLETPCPRFKRFLLEIFEDNPHKDEIIHFLQKLLGYGITGNVNEHIFAILFGAEGRNGKDTLLGIMKDVLGPVSGAVSNDVFTANDKFKSAGAATPHLCDLQGKRLVWGSETKQGDKLNIAQLKQITGGGEQSARQNYGKQYTFQPTHKLLLMTNHKPHANANDSAFWSRVCLINFGLRFVDDPEAENERKADRNLKDAIRQEASGILAWLVRGCLLWQQEGLAIPEAIKAETEKYRKEEDSVHQFLAECCNTNNSQSRTKAGELYNAYKAWAKDQMNHAVSSNDFSKEIEKRGYKKDRNNRSRIYLGIELIQSEEGLFPKTPSKERAI